MSITEKTEPFCKVCGSKKIVSLGNITNGNYAEKFLKNYSLLKCEKCHFEFIYPTPSDEVLKFIYSNPDYSAWEVVDKNQNKSIRYLNFEYYFIILEKYKKSGKILDCGCATAYFLDIAKKKGFDCYGIEISEIPFSIASKKHPKKIFKQNIEDLKISKGFFDVITMFDFLEHTKNPGEVLKRASSLLTASGLILITTPNTNSLSMSLFGKGHTNYILEHLNLFNGSNISYFLKKFGFDEVKISPAKKILNLSYAEKVFNTHNNFIRHPLGLLNRLLPEKISQFPIKVSFGDMLIIAKKVK